MKGEKEETTTNIPIQDKPLWYRHFKRNWNNYSRVCHITEKLSVLLERDTHTRQQQQEPFSRQRNPSLSPPLSSSPFLNVITTSSKLNLLIRMLPSNETKEKKIVFLNKTRSKREKIRKKHTCYTGLCEVIGVDLNNFNASTNLFLLATYILIIR